MVNEQEAWWHWRTLLKQALFTVKFNPNQEDLDIAVATQAEYIVACKAFDLKLDEADNGRI